MSFNKSVLKAKNDSELLSYIINVTPELKDEIDLPVQGESIAPIGSIIVNNERYKNAFINTINLIGLTIIKRNGWDNPWDFTKRGTLRFGQQIRELINDLCNVYDYNKEINDDTGFLKTEVPNVFNFIHEVNFQKFYKTTTSDTQLAMAFDNEGNLFDYIEDAISMLYESLKYDTYIVDKYMLCRRIIDGTITSNKIDNYNNLTPRQRVSALKSISNKMTFRSPNYNPAGIRRATSFDNQIVIINTDFEADFSTEVMATSYFRDEADMKARMVLIDGFDKHDTQRLSLLLEEAFVDFTEEDLEQLSTIPAVIISKEFFMDYDYALDNSSNGNVDSVGKKTEFYNPQTLRNNHFLHVWRVFSTSPFENAVVFTSLTPAIQEITLNPAKATLSAGLSVQLKAEVQTSGFANKAVKFEVTKGEGVTVNSQGIVKVPKDFDSTDEAPQIEIKASSIFDNSIEATADLTVL